MDKFTDINVMDEIASITGTLVQINYNGEYFNTILEVYQESEHFFKTMSKINLNLPIELYYSHHFETQEGKNVYFWEYHKRDKKAASIIAYQKDDYFVITFYSRVGNLLERFITSFYPFVKQVKKIQAMDVLQEPKKTQRKR